jgi:hypothetical protein
LPCCCEATTTAKQSAADSGPSTRAAAKTVFQVACKLGASDYSQAAPLCTACPLVAAASQDSALWSRLQATATTAACLGPHSRCLHRSIPITYGSNTCTCSRSRGGSSTLHRPSPACRCPGKPISPRAGKRPRSGRPDSLGPATVGRSPGCPSPGKPRLARGQGRPCPGRPCCPSPAGSPCRPGPGAALVQSAHRALAALVPTHALGPAHAAARAWPRAASALGPTLPATSTWVYFPTAGMVGLRRWTGADGSLAKRPATGTRLGLR